MANSYFKGEIYYIYPSEAVGNEQMGGAARYYCQQRHGK